MPTLDDYYRNKYQYSLEDYTTSTPEGDQQAVSYAPGYAIDLLNLRQQVESGQAKPWEREEYAKQLQAVMGVPMRDPSTLTYNAGDEAPRPSQRRQSRRGPLDAHPARQDASGQASPQESELFKTAYTMLADQNWRASVPQASDAFSPLGDNLLSARSASSALGATGGLAAAPLWRVARGWRRHLARLGTLSGIAGTGAGVLGQATDQEWLQKLGMGLGAAGGIAGGIGGLANLAGTWHHTRSVTRPGWRATRVGWSGAWAALPIVMSLKQAGGWLGTAGQLGGGVENLRNLLGGTGGSLQGVMGLLKPLQKIAGQFMQPGGRDEGGQGTPQRPVGATASAPQRPMDTGPAAQARGAVRHPGVASGRAAGTPARGATDRPGLAATGLAPAQSCGAINTLQPMRRELWLSTIGIMATSSPMTTGPGNGAGQTITWTVTAYRRLYGLVAECRLATAVAAMAAAAATGGKASSARSAASVACLAPALSGGRRACRGRHRLQCLQRRGTPPGQRPQPGH